MIDATSSKIVRHSSIHGDGQSFQNTVIEHYTNQDGDRLQVTGNFHFTINANGELTAFRAFEWRCVGG